VATGLEPSLLDHVWEGMKGLAIMILGILGYGLKRQVQSFDDLKRDVSDLKEKKADTVTLNDTIATVRESVEKIHLRIDSMYELLASEKHRRD